MFQKIIFAALAGLSIGLLHAAEPNSALGMRISTGTAPKLDGVISPGEWDDAAKLPPFTEVKPGVPLWDKLNEVMLKYDRENLYIGFRTYMMIDMDLAPQKDDTEAMANVESFDIRFVVPGQPKWRRFMVERGGRKFDQLFRGHKQDLPSAWNPEWTYRCNLTPQDFTSWSIWEGEIAIPWETIGTEPPKDRLQLSGMFIRYLGNQEKMGGGNRIVSWNCQPDTTSLIFDANYGALVFEPNRPVFRLDELKNYSRSTVAVKGRMLGPGSAAGGKVNAAIWDISNPKRMFDYTEYKFPGGAVDWKKTIKVKQAENGNGRIFVFDGDGNMVCKYPVNCRILPPFYCDALWNSTTDRVGFVGESEEGLRTGEQIRLALTSTDGKVVYESKIIDVTQGGAKLFDFSLDAAKVPEDTTFVATAELLRNQRIAEQSRFEIEKKFPVWKNQFEQNKVTAPPPGWEAVKVTENSAEKLQIGIRNHAYVFGASLLPEKVVLRDQPFSAQDWKFVVETSNGPLAFTGERVKLVAEDGRGVTLRYHGQSRDLTLDAEIRVEFDGLAYYRCRFTPRDQKGVTVKHLALECPINPETLRYMRGYAFEAVLSSSRLFAMIAQAKQGADWEPLEAQVCSGISGNGWRFHENFNNFYWIGGEDRGCLFVLPSRKNLSIDKVYNRVEDIPGKFRFDLELVNKPVVWNKPVDYEFGLMLTPTRQAPNPAGLRRVGQFANGLLVGKEHKRALSISDKYYSQQGENAKRFFRPEPGFEIDKDFFFGDMVASWIMRDVQDGNHMPDQKTREEIARECRGIREGHHGKPILWYDMLVTPPSKTDEWRCAPYLNMLADVQVMMLCPASPWPQAYLYGLRERIKDGVAGIYVDMSGFRGCQNRQHGCGYYDAEGKLTPGVPFLAKREFMLMTQKLIKENDPDSVIIYHGSHPVNFWTDLHIDGEGWQYARDYRTLTPEFHQLEMFTRAQSGSQGCFYNVLLYLHVPGAQKSKVTQEDALGLALLNGMHCFNIHAIEIYGNYITTKPLLDFGVDAADSEWIPYWRNPLSQYPAGPVAVSGWKRGDRELAVIFNTAYAPAEFDFGGREAVDRLKKGGVLSGKLELPPRSLQIVEFGAK